MLTPKWRDIGSGAPLQGINRQDRYTKNEQEIRRQTMN